MINDYWSCSILLIDNIQKPNTGEEFPVNIVVQHPIILFIMVFILFLDDVIIVLDTIVE
jgi:hypothetical protein